MARSGIIYGDSGTLKSTAVKHFSHYIYERTGKETLLVSMDGGGWAPAQPEIDAGLMTAYRCNLDVPLPTLRKISQGYFPEDVRASKGAETNMVPVDWSRYGGMAVEGVTSISQALMRHLADKQIKTGEEATSPFSQNLIVNGVKTIETFAGNSKGHYGFVQQQLYSLMTNFNSLPCDYVLFTGLESRAEEDDRTLIYGPQIAGKKATALVPSWVGDCIHAQGLPVKRVVQVADPADLTGKTKMETEIVETVVRMYFTKHPDPVTGIMYPAKPRVTPERLPELKQRYPGGYFEPTLTEGLDAYLRFVDSLTAKQTDAVDEWRKRVDARRKALATGAVGAGSTAVAAGALAVASKSVGG
jgi:hypothetical protein